MIHLEKLTRHLLTCANVAPPMTTAPQGMPGVCRRVGEPGREYEMDVKQCWVENCSSHSIPFTMRGEYDEREKGVSGGAILHLKVRYCRPSASRETYPDMGRQRDIL